MSVRAKFICNSITQYVGNRSVQFQAVYGKEGENHEFSKYTPSGNLQMTIDPETKAYDAFEVGKQYYLTIEEAEN